MFEELLNINIKTCSEVELMVCLQQTDAVATFRIQATQELLRRFGNRNCNIPAPEKSSQPLKVAIANGRRLSEEERQNINEKDFDVIMDTTTHSLRFRKNPARRSALIKSKLERIGTHSMNILRYMLEHPGQPFHCGNIYKVSGPVEEIKETGTFTKTISLIKNAFEQKNTSGPYIVKQFDWDGITGLRRGYTYIVDAGWRYLIIRHN